jgi:hypothetical protein
MRKRIILAAVAATALLGSAPVANASPMGGSAADTIDWLQREGYHVQLNGGPSQGSLSQCKATGVHGMRSSNVDDHGQRIDADAHDTVHVDVHCNDTR